jgi:hypothetical protein
MGGSRDKKSKPATTAAVRKTLGKGGRIKAFINAVKQPCVVLATTIAAYFLWHPRQIVPTPTPTPPTDAQLRSWNVDPVVVEAAMEEMQKDCVKTMTAEDREMVLFLYLKNVCPNAPISRLHFQSLINATEKETMSNIEESDLAAKVRLRRLLRKEGQCSNQVPTGVQTFDEAMAALPDWNDPLTSFIFHRDDPSMIGRAHGLAQRLHLGNASGHQEHRFCYIHAPHVLQHYLVCWATGHNNVVGMIDMARMIRTTFSSNDLMKHIFDDLGGSSHTMLRRILMPGLI